MLSYGLLACAQKPCKAGSHEHFRQECKADYPDKSQANHPRSRKMASLELRLAERAWRGVRVFYVGAFSLQFVRAQHARLEATAMLGFRRRLSWYCLEIFDGNALG
jgi:hypothetical protein